MGAKFSKTVEVSASPTTLFTIPQDKIGSVTRINCHNGTASDNVLTLQKTYTPEGATVPTTDNLVPLEVVAGDSVDIDLDGDVGPAIGDIDVTADNPAAGLLLTVGVELN